MQQSNLFLAMEAFNILSDTERALFIGVVDAQNKCNKIATKKQQKVNNTLPYEFSEEFYFKEMVKNHNSKVEKRLSRLNKTTRIANTILKAKA